MKTELKFSVLGSPSLGHPVERAVSIKRRRAKYALDTQVKAW
jgi:hypothetical protein